MYLFLEDHLFLNNVKCKSLIFQNDKTRLNGPTVKCTNQLQHYALQLKHVVYTKPLIQKKKKNTQHFLMVFTEVAELLKPLTMTYPNPFNKIKLLKSKIQRAVIYSQCETHEFCNI